MTVLTTSKLACFVMCENAYFDIWISKKTTLSLELHHLLLARHSILVFVIPNSFLQCCFLKNLKYHIFYLYLLRPKMPHGTFFLLFHSAVHKYLKLQKAKRDRVLFISLIPISQSCTCWGKLMVFTEVKYYCVHTEYGKSTKSYLIKINK